LELGGVAVGARVAGVVDGASAGGVAAAAGAGAFLDGAAGGVVVAAGASAGAAAFCAEADAAKRQRSARQRAPARSIAVVEWSGRLCTALRCLGWCGADWQGAEAGAGDK
jgi:hypothetical protein